MKNQEMFMKKSKDLPGFADLGGLPLPRDFVALMTCNQKFERLLNFWTFFFEKMIEGVCGNCFLENLRELFCKKGQIPA